MLNGLKRADRKDVREEPGVLGMGDRSILGVRGTLLMSLRYHSPSNEEGHRFGEDRVLGVQFRINGTGSLGVGIRTFLSTTGELSFSLVLAGE